MQVLIRDAEIIQPDSPLHLTKKDILLSNGKIKSIEDRIEFDGQVITSPDLKVSLGWFDMRVNYNDPGLEHKEDFSSAQLISQFGGFTDALVLPNTVPIVDTKNAVSYILKQSQHSESTSFWPMAALTENCEGKAITEMIDLNEAGAVAFTDGVYSVWHPDVLLKGLQYVQKFDGLIIDKPEETHLSALGQMHEGKVSTFLGLKGVPHLTETLTVQRNIELLKYSGGRLHLSLITCKESVSLIREAKAQGLNVTCDVGVNYLMFSEDDLQDYDTNLKVNPPYRTEEDREALIEGVADGTIDVIVSDHQPQDQESKKLEFDLAEYGSSNQQYFFNALLESLGEDYVQAVGCFTSIPRNILKIETPKIEVGSEASLTLFDPSIEWQYSDRNNKSKSEATPFYNKALKGKVIGTVNKGKVFLNSYED